MDCKRLIFTLCSAQVPHGQKRVLCWAPGAPGSALLYTLDLCAGFPSKKGLISRNGCKALIQILSFLIWLLHILMWNDILILFPGISKRKKIPLLLLELHFFLFKKTWAKQRKYKRSDNLK